MANQIIALNVKAKYLEIVQTYLLVDAIMDIMIKWIHLIALSAIINVKPVNLNLIYVPTVVVNSD